jgi:hypothetical protein
MELLMPISIGLERGPKGKSLGSQGPKKMKIEIKKVPGSASLRVSFKTVSLLE